MTRLQYKGREIEIFAAKQDNLWTWACTIDGIRAAANRDPDCCATLEQAVANAEKMACGLIDLEFPNH